jgi:hypothetical protein
VANNLTRAADKKIISFMMKEFSRQAWTNSLIQENEKII